MPEASRAGYSWFRTRGGRRFGLEFAVVVAAKLVLLTILWWACFTPATRPDVTPAGVADRLLAPATPARAARDD